MNTVIEEAGEGPANNANIDARLEDLIVLGTRLAEIMEKENALLAEHKVADVAAMATEKADVSRIFESRYKLLRRYEAHMVDADSDLRDRLRMISERIDGIAAENGRRLKATLDVHRRMVDTIADAARDARSGPGTYGKNGAVGMTGREAENNSAPVTYDKSL